jgi:hypothetical protein
VFSFSPHLCFFSLFIVFLCFSCVIYIYIIVHLFLCFLSLFLFVFVLCVCEGRGTLEHQKLLICKSVNNMCVGIVCRNEQVCVSSASSREEINVNMIKILPAHHTLSFFSII